MKVLALLGALALAAACTKHNDAVCCTTDEDCDAFGLPRRTGCSDGEVCQGHLCVAASCTEDTMCPADQPVCDPAAKVCGACATDNDCSRLSDTPHCDTSSGGCLACVIDEHCPAASPVCDNGTCRTCRHDSECASQVCDIDAGSCVAASEVVYASPTGADGASCSLAQPCSLLRAITIASSTVRMLPGDYGQAIDVAGARTLSIVATGAKMLAGPSTSFPIHVTAGAHVRIRGLDVAPLAVGHIFCTSNAGTPAKLTLVDVKVASYTPIDGGSYCTVQLVGSTIRGNVGPVENDATFEVDRSRFADSCRFTPIVARQNVRITNSVFDRCLVSFENSLDTPPSMSTFYIGYNTFVFDSGGGTSCPQHNVDHPRVLEFVNNVFYAPEGTNVLAVPTVGFNPCTVRGNVVFPETVGMLGADNLIADPRFIDFANKDYHLGPTSPAIDAAVPSAYQVDHDFDGTPRPQGAARDVGAFERTP